MRVSGQEYLRLSNLKQVSHMMGAPTAVAIASASAGMGSSSSWNRPVETVDVQQVVGLVAKQPEIREDIVASLRERIENGTYTVSGSEIGEMMYRRLMADRSA